MKDPNVDGRIILKLAFECLDRGIDWNDLTRDRDRWQALVNAVTNILVP